MIFKVVVHRDSVIFPTIGEYLVESSSGNLAADFALSVAKKNYPEEKNLFVRSFTVVDGEFIGKATQQNVQRTLRHKAAGKSKLSGSRR